MQVAMLSDAITHAVIGKQASIEMGVSDSAALMHIFSTTLYTYPRLATVREIICNGWDGHIITNRTDTPLQITLKDDLLSIRDFGPGIHHDKIGQIYGVFGNSTKRDDSTQTGGFGLGSKAPFSYVDNFEVISHHEGVKTVYRISKSSMEAGGKPSIDTIVSVPTTETGLQVKVNIQNQHMGEFSRLVHEVLTLGEIKASVNGEEPVEGLPLEHSPTGYLINSFSGTLTTRINVRYGNVVYPLPKHDAYEDDWYRVNSSIGNLWGSANIIFMCPPDTVSIAPSREALILTEGTVATLKGLLESFDSTLDQTAKISSKQIHAARRNQALREEKLVLASFTQDLSVKRYQKESHATGAISFTTRQAFLVHALHDMEDVDWGDVLMKRIKKAGKDGMIDAKFANDICHTHALANHKISRREYPRNDLTPVFHRHITKPLYDLLGSTPVMSKDRMYCVFKLNRWTVPGLTRLKDVKVALDNAENLVSFGLKRVVIGRSKLAMQSFANGQSRTAGWIAYHVQNKEKTIAEVEAAFKAIGYEVHNVIPVKEEVEIDPNAPAVVRKASPKRKGYLSLVSSFNPTGNSFLLSTARANATAESEVHDPVAYVVLNSSTECPMRFSQLSEKSAQLVATHFGDKIAVVISTQVQKLIDKGVPEVSTFVANYVDDTLSARPDFPCYLAFGKLAKDRQYRADTHKFLGSITRHEKLMNDLGLRFYITPETDMLISFYEESQHRHYQTLDLPKCKALFEKIKPHPDYDKLVHKVESSPWKHFLNMNHLVHILGDPQTSPEHYAIACELALKLLK